MAQLLPSHTVLSPSLSPTRVHCPTLNHLCSASDYCNSEWHFDTALDEIRMWTWHCDSFHPDVYNYHRKFFFSFFFKLSVVIIYIMMEGVTMPGSHSYLIQCCIKMSLAVAVIRCWTQWCGVGQCTRVGLRLSTVYLGSNCAITVNKFVFALSESFNFCLIVVCSLVGLLV